MSPVEQPTKKTKESWFVCFRLSKANWRPDFEATMVGGWMKHSVFQRETTISLASRLRKKVQFLLLVCKAVKGTQYMDSHLLLCKAWLMQFIFHNPFLSHCLIESKLQCHQRRHPNLSYRENLINHNVKDDVDNVSNHECSACYKTWDLFFPTCHTYLHNKAIIVFFLMNMLFTFTYLYLKLVQINAFNRRNMGLSTTDGLRDFHLYWSTLLLSNTVCKMQLLQHKTNFYQSSS